MTIEQKQHLLAYHGYYKEDVDGIWGKESEEATRRFQNDYGGLKVDGICGAETEKALKNAVANGMPEKKVEDTAAGGFWGDIKYFEREEFKCKCGGKYCNGYPVEMSEKLVKIADKVRDHFGNKVVVSSGIRCEKHNAKVGGVSNSRHLKGKAMDFCVSGLPASLVLPYVQSLSGIRYAYAIDTNFVHMDVE